MKTTTIIVTAELAIDNDLIYDMATLRQELAGQFIKIKSGLYENIACGYVCAVSIPDNTEERN